MNTEEFSKMIYKMIEDVQPCEAKDYPIVWYNTDGDILHVYLEISNGYFGKWINHKLTTLHEDSDGHMIGFQIWDYSKLNYDQIMSIIKDHDKDGKLKTILDKYILDEGAHSNS